MYPASAYYDSNPTTKGYVMKKPKLTDWIPASTPPVRVGIYEMRDLAWPYHFWDGSQWLGIAAGRARELTKKRIKNAGPMPRFCSYYLTASWRGLASDPKASA